MVMNSVTDNNSNSNPQIAGNKWFIEQKKSFPPQQLEEMLIASQVAIHNGRYNEAIAINQELSSKFPKSFQPKYNIGYILDKLGRYDDAVVAYDDALSINSFCTDALINKALSLRKLSRNREARQCYYRLQQLYPDTIVKSPFTPEITMLTSTSCPYGTLKVIDDGDSLMLTIDDQIQGSVFKDPSAAIISPILELGTPGPVARSLFAVAWLISACHSPNGSGLVLGLGCGAGPVMILSNFPNITLTVIDINPTLIQLAFNHFPLLQYYVDCGRLSIIEGDAVQFLENNETRYDFILFDIYNGSPKCAHEFGSRYFIKLMCNSAEKIWCNIIGCLGQPHLHRILAAFDETDTPIQRLFATNSELYWMVQHLNWLITTEENDTPLTFIPFSELEGPTVRSVRQDFKTIQSMQVTRHKALEIARELNIQQMPYPDPIKV